MRYITPYANLYEKLKLSCEEGKTLLHMPYDDFKNILRELLESAEVDEKWYRNRYPGVDAAIREGKIKSAREHFLRDGYFEGRITNGMAPSTPSSQPNLAYSPSTTEIFNQGRQEEKVKKNLTLHIGHGKTGSSFIQSVLVLNKAKLESLGVLYPEHESDMSASAGRITSGNGDLILDPAYKLNPERNYLFSNEDLFNRLLKQNELERVAMQLGFNLRVFLYTRNVFDVLFSGWGQWVKRGGSVKDLNSFLAEDTSNLPFSNIILWLDAAERFKFDITVRNYSNHKSDLASVFIKDLLKLTEIEFDIAYPDATTVNRSLTFAEYEIQRAFNRNLTDSSKFISDVLVDKCPDIKASKLKCSETSYDLVVSRIKPIIDDINRRIPESEMIIIENKDEVVSNETTSEYTISAKQIEVLVDSICKRMLIG